MTNSALRHDPAGGAILTPFPSATALALALGARLTLRGLTLRRNPWTFGDSVSHAVCATHVSIRTSDTSSAPRGTPSPAYGTLRYHSRRQGSGIRDQNRRDEGLAACGRCRGTRPAIARPSPRRYSRDHG